MRQTSLNLLLLAWLCTLVSLCSSLRAECPVTATGLCTPGVEETIVITETESIEYEADGHTVTTTTTTDTNTTPNTSTNTTTTTTANTNTNTNTNTNKPCLFYGYLESDKYRIKKKLF